MTPLRSTALAALLALTALLGTAPSATAAVRVGIGESGKSDPRAAGQEAALQAKEALGNGEARLVLVFDNAGDGVEIKQQMLDGVGAVFANQRVFGCSAYSPLTPAGNADTVGVLALGGDIRFGAAVADVDEGQQASGKAIGAALRSKLPEAGDGRLVILLGACTVPRNAELVRGVQSVLGSDVPMAGGAASREQFVYYRGKPHSKCNLGLLLAGDFDLTFAGGTAPSRTADEVIEVGGQVARRAFGKAKDRATLALVCNCAGRYMELGDRYAEEFHQIKTAAGDIPFFGFYSNGEIGPLETGASAKGVGHHVIIAILQAR